ncbi:C39 family peptidase [Microcoleus sp. FACHB-68]|uniref:C39 family peptidase n=1 Tax=Microcoleus sp. FACHB-68 TaxID=2692826 RepID=UPI0016831C98|nr:C39 family peptidase [Microcoleus sp. FACHB-68]MBD1938411.1 C39 family peptidase [Microcoleus sp. FACHB-68]
MNIQETLSLKILQDTFFKILPADSATLTDRQKIKLTAGQTFKINRSEGISGHLKVELNGEVSPIGKIGYFYAPHVQIIKSSPAFSGSQADASAVPPGLSLLTITQKTKLKRKPEDSSQLSAAELIELPQGQTFYITGYACVERHFRVSFTQEIPNFGNSGYLYYEHVQIKKDGRDVQFDANAVIITILETTIFKKQPAEAVNLRPDEQITVPAGMIFGVAGYTLESGHLKVSLTENLPGFGNTGYFYPDFVQLSRGGKLFNASPALTYQGPSEVLVNQSTTLNGSFDPQQVANVALVAEDKYPLEVTLNRSSGSWQVKLDRGFKDAGARWLRLKGTDTKGQVVSSQIVHLTVSANAGTVGQSLTLKILKDTFFKTTSGESANLNSQQKILVNAGQTFTVSKYGYLDGHLKVTLSSPLMPVGNFGYFYEKHVQLSKGSQVFKFEIEDVTSTPLSAQMLVTETTVIKAKPVDSSSLLQNQKADLLLGQILGITGYACIEGHFRVTLTQSIPGFGNVGYVYWRHVQIKRDGKVVPFDPDALTITVGQTTILKKKLAESSRLSASEKIDLALGRVYGISSYSLEDAGHIKVALTEELPQFGNTGYLYTGHIKMQRGSRTFDPYPSQVELNVPYFSQRDNPRFYWSTCNVTSIAMPLYYYGVRSSSGGQLEDELLEWCFNRYGEGSHMEHSVLSQLIRAYGFKTSFSTTRTWSEIKIELINRRPVVLAGDFTATGHILCVIGYNSSGLIVNDPWGDALTGYADTEGRKLLYPYGYLNQVAGPDGKIWAHCISR